jgi:hypothetical protein
MEELDRIGARVTLMGILGGIGGAASAILKGHARISRAAGFAALSCAMSATALLGAERIVDLCINKNNSTNNASKLLQQQQQQQQDGLDGHDLLEQFRQQRKRTMLITHAAGGAIGGALLGAIYTRRPFQGMAVFIPVMMLVGLGESRFQDKKDEEYVKRQRNEAPTRLAADLHQTHRTPDARDEPQNVANMRHDQSSQ